MPNTELVFSTFNHSHPEDCFNSELYQEARLFFADKAEYQTVRAAGDGTAGPYCADCKWDQLKADIDRAEVAQALRTFGKGLIDAQTILILSDW